MYITGELHMWPPQTIQLPHQLQPVLSSNYCPKVKETYLSTCVLELQKTVKY